MTLIVRQPYAAATLAGASVGSILSARCSFGFDQRVSEAYITVPTVPQSGKQWDPVVLTLGATQASAQVRFTGVLLEYDYTLWPRAVTLVCKGNLYRAAAFTNTDGNGTDLTNFAAGQTDVAMVKQVLNAVPGLTYNAANIGGTGKVLGTTSYTVYNGGFGNVYTGPFTWGGPGQLNQSVGETALSMIERLDEISEGYRLFETAGGTLYRFQISGRPRNASDFTFTEGQDIFSGSSQRTLIPARNRFLVTGFDYGVGVPQNFFVKESAPFTPGLDQTMAFSSPMIEKPGITAAAGAGGSTANGQSCEAIANYLNGEYNREIVKLRMTTLRDDLIGPGQTHSILSQARLGISEPLWVQHVDVELSANGEFSQTMTYIGGGLPDSYPAPPVS